MNPQSLGELGHYLLGERIPEGAHPFGPQAFDQEFDGRVDLLGVSEH
ncbi:unannotated protein [freshwater metagenome]|uniref:Unannotated protein n=1 Tax=freshwater metagenome TaxID=449393 RepID=A0A6J7JR70_9ZZZZ